jgi:uncharacterized protein YjdB
MKITTTIKKGISLFLIVAFSSFIASAQITDLPVTASPANVSSGGSTNITTTGSQQGYTYSLRNNSNNALVGNPLTGTGNNLSFNTGAITTSTTYNVYASNNYALKFAASYDYIDLSNDNRGIDKEVSVGAWIKSFVYAPSQSNIVLDYGANDAGYILKLDGQGRVSFSGRDGTNTFKSSGVSSASVVDGQWHYVVGTANLTTGVWSVYVDGVLKNSSNNGAGNSLSNSDKLYIGKTFSTSDAYRGSVMNVTIWDKELSAFEVSTILNNCLVGTENNIVGHFPINEGTGSVIVDYSAQAIDGSAHLFLSSTWELGNSFCRTSLQMTQTATVNVLVPVSSINVQGQGGLSTITTAGGTLQMEATVLPANADDATYTWSVTNSSGSATINSSGLLTAITDGTVSVTATASDGSGVTGTKTITLSSPILVSSIYVQGQGGVSSIPVNGGTLQMEAVINPTNATNPNYTWSVANGSGSATISASGFLTATTHGTVIVSATASDASGVSGTKTITLTPPILVSQIYLQGQGGATTITTAGGTLQMEVAIFPSNAENPTFTGSVTNGTGSATLNSAGLLTALTDGTVTVTATANDASGVSESVVITISNQSVGLKEATLQNINIYPNPVQNQLFIELTEGKISAINILGLFGKVVLSNPNYTKSIDVSGLSKGIYILKIETENGVSATRFVKQ